MLFQPSTLDEALKLRHQLQREAVVVNGGTDVVVAMNRRALRPTTILDLSHLQGFNAIEKRNGFHLLSGGVTFAQLAALNVRCVAEAAMSVGGPQIRNRGTIAGNLATASPAGDGSTALLAVDAEVELTSVARGSRWIKVVDFFEGYKKTALQEDELITRVRVPVDWASGWYKIGKRGAVNISVAACAVGRRPDGRFCVAFASAAPTPLRATRTEQYLSGQPLTDAGIERAVELARAEVSPIDDYRASAEYRRAMCGVMLRRVLKRLGGE